MAADPIELVPLDRAALAALAAGRDPALGFAVPAGWPDGADRDHVARWQDRAPGVHGVWRPHAIVVVGAMVGHVGFHGAPVPIADALADPSYRGTCEPAPLGAVEIGYTVFADVRCRGHATGAVRLLLALARGKVSAVLATVADGNLASRRVLDRVGGFVEIGRCADGGITETVLRRDLGDDPPRAG